jgi:4-hydroxy-2-oxoheptanedioate aldolase
VNPTFDNPVKTKLAQGGIAFGAVVIVPSPLAVQYAANTGVDFVWLETEHTTFGVEALEMLPLIVRRKNITPLIRVCTLDPGLIKKALDSGASAIMVPQIDNAEQAALAVKYAKYPPEGERGISPMWTLHTDIVWSDYLPHANKETLIVVQVETLEGMKNVEAIAAVPGVDVVLAGPMDLSAAVGQIGQPSHPLVQDFLAEFPSLVAKQGKAAGIAIAGLDQAKLAVERGYRFINFSEIMHDGVRGIRSDLEVLRGMAK